MVIDRGGRDPGAEDHADAIDLDGRGIGHPHGVSIGPVNMGDLRWHGAVSGLVPAILSQIGPGSPSPELLCSTTQCVTILPSTATMQVRRESGETSRRDGP